MQIHAAFSNNHKVFFMLTLRDVKSLAVGDIFAYNPQLDWRDSDFVDSSEWVKVISCENAHWGFNVTLCPVLGTDIEYVARYAPYEEVIAVNASDDKQRAISARVLVASPGVVDL